jgi:23S rRNA (adenine1618-N6)-methyltransferase
LLDIDKESLENAKKIINENKLENKIKIKLQKNKEFIFKGILKEKQSANFTICNPPFFSELKEKTKVKSFFALILLCLVRQQCKTE